MHPAFSVIVFTTATGAGYGLLALLGLLAPAGLVPADPLLGAVGLGLALALITGGLLSSTAHLTHPGRAWRAFSQWRTSWLSREGVFSVATYLPAGLFALSWVALGRVDGLHAPAGIAAAAGAAATVLATAMIYASLKPVAQWHTRFTAPCYLVFAVMTGATLLNAIVHSFGYETKMLAAIAPLVTVAAWLVKTAAWRHADALPAPASLNSATGLAAGTVRSLEWPHTEENYLLKEMGYRVARKHAAKLRVIVHVFAFAVPLALGLAAWAADGATALAACLLAVPIQALGMLVERWLFFAEAKHTVALYYGR